MFFWRRRPHEFELRSLLNRVAGTLGMGQQSSDNRDEDRCNSTVPVLVAPWTNGRPDLDEATTALTRNFSDRGVALVMHQPLRVDEVVLGLILFGDTPNSLDGEPRFARGRVRQNVSLGGGYWQIGLELLELLDKQRYREISPLIPLTERLKPNRAAEALPTNALLQEVTAIPLGDIARNR